MANNVKNVSTGKPKITGAIYRALREDTTTIPTSESALLGEEFKCLGYVSDDGVTNETSMNSEKIRAWGGDVVITTQTEKDDTFQFKLIEVMNADVLKTVYGNNNVTLDRSVSPNKVSVAVNSEEQPECVWVIDMILRGNQVKRIVIPCGKITDIGEIVYKDDEVIGYDITITAMADANGNTHYEYMTVEGDGLV